VKVYLLSIYQPDGEPPAPAVLEPIMRETAAVVDEMKTAGAWVFNGGLHPASTARVIRMRGAEALMTDGPFTEGKEHIGGCVILAADDLDAALEWGCKLASATTLPIEVRPFSGTSADWVRTHTSG
jgi:hypothetical protein